MKKILTFIAAIIITGNLVAQDSFIIISKQDMKLRRYDFKGNLIEEYPVACGRNYGNKNKRGDNKTPEGVFTVQQIQNSSAWTHDFGDGKGQIKNAYGPYFIRLKTGFQGIGIHGTHAPESMGKRTTEGCIRLKNEDLLKLVKNIKLSMVVIITSSAEDALADKLYDKKNVF
ncbi:MAG: L,D-transpeptidase [Prevotellaceae bacterium]|jgi:lipoprotein-anchoring transpeptidase ErfK/SrfK|nr:L,D-transpeptidase [Prevotellaceae bacterium]